ncbi:hypothetical protein PtA15_15A297 [Puccinia triticina]|uniref:3-hydroxyacyl-CoA dehydrogenase NAD binding domain-containing protein n=1 Tax=Puccinia triticina TaxID=208348 RepID=A0ABY7D2R0_9BASI|nr:uncharacterized protein PtA15_15A297 [Puccinia triticina]WAQ91904.1 hypothetical protein PtA15_15A297 [Puccinia triticina]
MPPWLIPQRHAIAKKLLLKQTIFSQLASICKPRTILASNTSSILLTKIAASAINPNQGPHQLSSPDTSPSRVVGLHFFNPVAFSLNNSLTKRSKKKNPDYKFHYPGASHRPLAMPPSVAIWSLAPSPAHTRLAIACDNGAIRIAAIADNQLELVRKLDRCNTRLLSLAWGISPSKTPPPLQEPTDSQLFFVAGGADSSLRKWAAGSGRCLNRMTVEKLQGKHTLVWTVTVLKSTIRAHRADILCMVPSADGCSVFTLRVDQKTCQLTLHTQSHAGNTSETTAAQSRWLLAGSRRLHSHDGVHVPVDANGTSVWPPYCGSPYSPKPLGMHYIGTLVIPFVGIKIKSADWHQRDAAIMALNSPLDRSAPETMYPLVSQALPTLIKMMQDPSINFKDTAA